MIQPIELKLPLPMVLSNGVVSTTTKVWDILVAGKNGDMGTVKKLVDQCPELIYAQYNYTPPIHFAVREGHIDIVKYLLDNGAHDPDYKTYPFSDSLQMLAQDRGFIEIVNLLDNYAANPSLHKFKGDNGEIQYKRTELQKQFEKAVYNNNINKTREFLEEYPALAQDETFFWSEGILLFAAKKYNRPMLDLLMDYGAKVPVELKWAQFYYFEHDQGAIYMMEKGMDPNTKSWHHVTVLHDMAQKGNISKAELLLKYHADINPIEEEYQSTPLGLATRWGHHDMVEYLIKQGADLHKSGASWSTPLAWARKKRFTEIEKTLVEAGAIY